jgi:hypothetical protein
VSKTARPAFQRVGVWRTTFDTDWGTSTVWQAGILERKSFSAYETWETAALLVAEAKSADEAAKAAAKILREFARDLLEEAKRSQERVALAEDLLCPRCRTPKTNPYKCTWCSEQWGERRKPCPTSAS